MPLSAAKPIMEAGIKASLTPKLLNIAREAFKNGMDAIQKVAELQNSGNIGTDVFDLSIDAGAIAFSLKMSELADEIASIITDQVNTYTTQALITVPPGAAVVTAGTPAAQTGTVTTPAVATIS